MKPKPKHSVLGASAAHRWMKCNQSVLLHDKIIREGSVVDDTSEHAFRGTIAHTVFERLILDRDLGTYDPYEWTGWTFGDIDPDCPANIASAIFEESDVEAVERAVEVAVMLIAAMDSPTIFTEMRFVAPEFGEHFYGTSDLVLYDGHTLWVIDYKHGAGKSVNAKDNKQLLYYALGAISKLKIAGAVKCIKLAILQPRIAHGSAVSTQEMTYEECQSKVADLMYAFGSISARLRLGGEPVLRLKDYKQGSWCGWCPAKTHCPKFVKNAVDDFNDLDATTDIATVDDALVLKIYENRSTIKAIIKVMEGRVRHMMEQGNSVPGYKLVESVGNRRYIDAADAERALLNIAKGKDIYTKRAILPPAQVEKVLGKQSKGIVNALCERPSKGLVVAPDSDKRPAVVTQDFNNIDAQKQLENLM